MDTNDKKHTKRRSASVPKENRRRRTEAKVVYSEAKPFNRNRFILQLVTVVAVVVAIIAVAGFVFRDRIMDAFGKGSDRDK